MRDREIKERLKSHGEKLRNSIDAPFDITEKINETEIDNMKKITPLRKVLYSAAGIAAAFVLTFNLLPNLALAASDVPVLGAVVKVVTFGRFHIENGGVDADVVTPKIEGLLNKELEEKLNAEFKENADLIISAFEKEVKEMEEEFGGEDYHLGIDAGYIVRTDTEDYLALDCYIVNTVGSSSTKHSFYTINKKTGELLTLQGLFKENADYISPISEYILKDMKRQNEEGSAYYWVNDDEPLKFEKIKPDQNFFINENGNLVICFDKYEVAAGYVGSPEFEISKDAIKEILK